LERAKSLQLEDDEGLLFGVESKELRRLLLVLEDGMAASDLTSLHEQVVGIILNRSDSAKTGFGFRALSSRL
jgi:hypothetical protein